MAGPLAGLRVLDFSTLLPGPFASMWLADLGADVIRIVAPPTRRESSVGVDPAVDVALNRNKRSIGLDLKRQGSGAVVERFLRRADVLLEQFRPGVMSALGWGYQEARAVNPAIVYCSLTGYGQTGPDRRRAGHDINYLARAGVLSYSGRRGDGPPPYGVQIADLVGALSAVGAVLAALYRRAQAGDGEYVDVAMLDTAIALNVISGSAFLAGGRTPAAESELLNGATLYDCYRTRDDRFLSVGSLEPKFVKAFFSVLGRADLAPESGRLADIPDVGSVKQWVADTIARRSLAEWLEVFGEYDACVEPVLDLPEMMSDPQTVARDMIVEVPGDGRTVKQIAHPVKFSSGGAAYRHAGRHDGAESDELLRELDFPQGEIEQMRRDGVVF